VISREFSSTGTLLTTRLLLKRGALPRWVPKGLVIRAESWVVEESEVDPEGKVLRCRTRNLDHVKVMQVHESHVIRPTADGYVHIVLFKHICIIDMQLTCKPTSKTIQNTEARILSGFGWGLTKRIESHAFARVKAHMQRVRFKLFSYLSHKLTVVQSREGVSHILDVIRQSRLKHMTMGATSYLGSTSSSRFESDTLVPSANEAHFSDDEEDSAYHQGSDGSWAQSNR